MENPKLVGSGIIDAIPQTGNCPHRCPECFYNGGRFYRTLDEPLLPCLEEVGDRIVRVNSGNDSNHQRDLVLKTTAKYKHKFYNTSVPELDFPAPVVLTVNPEYDKLHLIDPPVNLMFVRVRAGLWDHELVQKVLDHYGDKVPVVVTFMRYYDVAVMPNTQGYVEKKHILNTYMCPQTHYMSDFMVMFAGRNVRMCGTPWSSLCINCGNCAEFYWKTRLRMADACQTMG